MEEGRRNHGVYGQDNAYDMFINIKVERPNNSYIISSYFY